MPVIISRVVLASTIGIEEGFSFYQLSLFQNFLFLRYIAKIILPKLHLCMERINPLLICIIFFVYQNYLKLTLLLVVVGYFLLEPIVTIILPDYKPEF